MTTTINKVDKFLEAFPNKIIKHTGRPDYEVLNNIKTALKRNFATVPSTLGGGAHGYLGAVLTPAEYAAATPLNTPQFIEPAFPGAAAVIPPNSTGPQISAIERQFNKALRQWTEYKNLTDAGKKFIQDGIDDMYLKGITDRNVGLAHISIRDILAYLFQNYGNITQYDIEENDKKLKEKWDANTPIEMLFDQIEDAQDFAAAAGQPYSNNQLLTTVYNLVYATGLFFDDCKAWNRLPANQKTMDNFKTTFQQAQRELRDQQRTAQQAGFQANGIWCQPTTNNDQPLQETAEALANLATATTSDRQALQNLTNTVKELSNQIKAKDKQIDELIKAMTRNSTGSTNKKTPDGKRKIAVATVTPMDTWLDQNIIQKHVVNQDQTTTATPHDKIPWGATWKESPTMTPDKQGRQVGT